MLKRKPIETFDEDLLDLKNYVLGLCAYINKIFQENKNASIGIIGRWGDGKTSVINLCLEELKKQNKQKQKVNRISIIFIIAIIIICVFIILVNSSTIINWLCINLNIIDTNKGQINLILFSLLCLLLPFKQYKNILANVINSIDKFYKYFFIKNQIVEIRFTPWNCSNKEQMLSEYLKLLSNELHFVVPNIANKLIKYSKIISGIDLSKFESLLDSNENLSTLKQEIIKTLELTKDKKIIVIIDDLDRIQGDEIFNMLKLIGSIANFPNIINIVAYDKEYICKNLNKYFFNSNDEINSAKKYLQKIIPFEFPLPKINYNTLYTMFFEKLETIIENEDYNKNNLKLHYLNTFGRYINNIRDIKEFFGAFDFHYKIFKENKVNININDLLYITAIKTFNYELWQKLYQCCQTYVYNDMAFYIGCSDNTKEREKDYFDKTLDVNNLFLHEKTMLGLLIQDISKIEEYEIRVIDDFNNYDIKRFWSKLSYNMYFSFNPVKSNIKNILLGLSNKNFTYNEFLNILKTDTDWSDLEDIVCSNQYISKLAENDVLNFICFILYYANSQNKFKFRQFYNKLFTKITVKSFVTQITNIISDFNCNFDALIELVYVFFMYQNGTMYISQIKKINDNELELLNSILLQIKKRLNTIKIDQMSIRTIYYLCLAFGQIDSEIHEIIQQKIYNDVQIFDDYDLLEYLKHFMFNSNDDIYSMESLGKDEIFTLETKQILKNKLSLISNNSEIMQNVEYNFFFSEEKYSGMGSIDKKLHIVEFILNQYLKDV